MHKHDQKLGPDEQDKRSVIPIESKEIERWLMGSVGEATESLSLAHLGHFDARSVR